MSAFSRVAVLFLALLVSAPASAEAGLGAGIASQGTPKGVAPCMTCHGPDGAGMASTGYPRIAGLDAGYMAKQLRDFQAGTRSNPIMEPMAKNLTDEEIAAVSTYYAALAVSPPGAATSGESAAATVPELVRWGDWTGRSLPGCADCHGPDGNGIGPHFPGIAG